MEIPTWNHSCVHVLILSVYKEVYEPKVYRPGGDRKKSRKNRRSFNFLRGCHFLCINYLFFFLLSTLTEQGASLGNLLFIQKQITELCSWEKFCKWSKKLDTISKNNQNPILLQHPGKKYFKDDCIKCRKKASVRILQIWCKVLKLNQFINV